MIAYPTANLTGKYHAANPVSHTARCNATILLDMVGFGAIHTRPGVDPHPIVCRRCLTLDARRP